MRAQLYNSEVYIFQQEIPLLQSTGYASHLSVILQHHVFGKFMCVRLCYRISSKKGKFDDRG